MNNTTTTTTTPADRGSHAMRETPTALVYFTAPGAPSWEQAHARWAGHWVALTLDSGVRVFGYLGTVYDHLGDMEHNGTGAARFVLGTPDPTEPCETCDVRYYGADTVVMMAVYPDRLDHHAAVTFPEIDTPADVNPADVHNPDGAAMDPLDALGDVLANPLAALLGNPSAILGPVEMLNAAVAVAAAWRRFPMADCDERGQLAAKLDRLTAAVDRMGAR